MTALALIAAGAVMDFPGEYLVERLDARLDKRWIGPTAFFLLTVVFLALAGALTPTALLVTAVLSLLRGVMDEVGRSIFARHAGWFLARQVAYILFALALPEAFDGGAGTLALLGWCGACLQALAGKDMAGAVPVPAALLMAVWLLIWLTAGSGRLIGLTLSNLRLREPLTQLVQATGTPAPDPRMGLFIGWAERVLTLALVMAGAYTGLGVLAAVKTAARFPEFKSRAFAEYYILGTLLSLLCGIVLSAILTGLSRCV